MAQHTQGQLHIGGQGRIIYDSNGWGVANATVYHGRQEPGTANANANRLVACWNACEGISTSVLELNATAGGVAELERQRDAAEARVEWLQKVNTLHRQADILYVVDGYEVTIVWDDYPISEGFHGATVAEAIDKAMVGFDLDARHQFQDRDIYGHERQMAAITAQRDELLAAMEQIANSNPDSTVLGLQQVAAAAIFDTKTTGPQISIASQPSNGEPSERLTTIKLTQPARYTSITKGGSYEKLGVIHGAGKLKGFAGVGYRDPVTGAMFIREPECFAARMKLIKADGGAE